MAATQRQRARASAASAKPITAAVRWLRANRQSLQPRGGAWVAVSAKGRVVARGRTLQDARVRALKLGLGGQVVLTRVARRTRVGSAV